MQVVLKIDGLDIRQACTALSELINNKVHAATLTFECAGVLDGAGCRCAQHTTRDNGCLVVQGLDGGGQALVLGDCGGDQLGAVIARHLRAYGVHLCAQKLEISQMNAQAEHKPRLAGRDATRRTPR